QAAMRRKSLEIQEREQRLLAETLWCQPGKLRRCLRWGFFFSDFLWKN
ncbi:MAG: hypothetical protein HUU01_05820, partial [Saprospiraceae bacterium]|nr:hypothetical protein [Saprospiraceae bacterium]